MVKLIKHISAILLGAIFLVSSSGFLLFKSHCECTGNQQVSVFVERNVCESAEMDTSETIMSCCVSKEEHQCQQHVTECDCDQPEVTYVKLKNQVVKEEVKFTKVKPVEIFLVFTSLQFNFWDNEDSVENETYVDPPPLIHSSHDFLIHIQQLKIPLVA